MPNHIHRPGTVMFLLCFFCFSCISESKQTAEVTVVPIDDVIEIPPVPAIDPYGFEKELYEQMEDRIRRNESLYVILRRYDVSPLQIDQIRRAVPESVNLNRMRPGQQYRVYLLDGEAVGMVWSIDRRNFVVLNWEEDEIEVTRDQFEIRRVEASVSGTIERSLYETLQQEGVSRQLGLELARIYAWQIDFFRIRRGDAFKVIYDELYIDDDFYGIGQIHSADFYHRGNSYKAYYFDGETQEGYFDEESNSLQRDLLQAPFEYSQRVTSSFSHNRRHPILNERRPHYGVDYAAPRGTPIIAVGDGKVTEARHRGGNGNIVQIRHNSVYRTAYLHMSRFANGIRPGSRVEQGQIIGYVGATGLATGPHVCYRLYKNDQPINSRTADLPVSVSLDERYSEAFSRLRESYDAKLAAISAPDGAEELFSIVLSGAETD